MMLGRCGARVTFGCSISEDFAASAGAGGVTVGVVLERLKSDIKKLRKTSV